MAGDLPSPGVENNQPKKEIDKSNPYVQLLLGTAFVTEETLATSGLENVPEYQVLKTLKKGKVSQDELEVEVDNPLAPVAVKNLISAELVVQQGQFYQLSETSKSKL